MEMLMQAPASLAKSTKPPSLVYLASLSTKESRRTMHFALVVVARELTDGKLHHTEVEWHRLDPIVLGLLRSTLLERYQPRTINRYLAAIRGVLQASWLEGLMRAEQLRRLEHCLRSVPKPTNTVGKMLSREELIKQMDSVAKQDNNKAARDMAILAVMFEAGLRSSEVCKLDLKDYSKKFLHVRKSKRGKYRDCPINKAAKYIEDWLWVRGDWEGPLFVQFKFGSQVEILRERLAPRALNTMVAKLADKTGVRWTPHDARRTFISMLLDSGVDIAVAADLAGHSSVDITRGYDRRPETARIQAVEGLSIPI